MGTKTPARRMGEVGVRRLEAGANHSSEVARMREPSAAEIRSAMLGASND